MVLKAFKMACLGYFPTNVQFRGSFQSRQSLLILKSKIIDELWNKVQFHIPYGFIEDKVENCCFDDLYSHFSQNNLKEGSNSPPKLNIMNEGGDINTLYQDSNRRIIELAKSSRESNSKKGLNLDLFDKAKLIKRDILRQKYKCLNQDRFKPNSSLNLNMDFLDDSGFQS